MKKKFGLLIATVLILTGCSSDFSSPFSTSNFDNSYDLSSDGTYSENQLVSYDAYVTAETKQYKQDAEAIVKEITSKGGVIVSQNSHMARNYYTDFIGTEMRIEAQIPKDQFESVLETLKSSYQLNSFSLSSRDVTNDIEETKEDLTVLKDRLDQVNKQLEQDGLTFNQEQDLKNEKQSLEDQIADQEKQAQNQADSVEYSYLNLSLREVDYYTNEGYPAWMPFARAFKNIFVYLAYGLVAGIVVALAIIPFLFVGSLTYLLVRKFQYKMFEKLKRKMEKKQKEEQIRQKETIEMMNE